MMKSAGNCREVSYGPRSGLARDSEGIDRSACHYVPHASHDADHMPNPIAHHEYSSERSRHAKPKVDVLPLREARIPSLS